VKRDTIFGLIRRVFTVMVIAFVFAGCQYSPSLQEKRARDMNASYLSPPTQAPSGWAALRAVQTPEAVPGSHPSLDEELWVIERAPEAAKPADDSAPGCGALMAKLPKQEKQVPLPLKHTDVKAAIAGYIATVDVTQQYHNPYGEKIEAVYVFPLPHNAAVNEFIMTIGERRIRGIIREREEAKRIYEEAKRQGYVASLLTQERPNIFTQSIANIEPGKQIDINIRYFHTLAYTDGQYEFVFPMVVGPRFNPPGSTDGVGAVAHGSRGASGQKTEVQYLKPGERSGHDIAVSVDIDAGVAIEDVSSPSHVITKSIHSPENLTVALSPLDRIPNKDFVLRYKVAGKQIKSALLTHRDKRGGFFTLMLYPPADLQSLQRQPMELVFVLDCSGSMSGAPIAKAKAAARHALQRLGPDDTFQIVTFSIKASQLGSAPVPATAANVRRGLGYIDSLQGEGGTMMIEGIKAALDFPHDPRRLRVVSFMTDGYIGNEAEILGEIHNRIGSSRIFSFGVGSSVNRYLIEGMARAGRGAVAHVGLDESGGAAVDAFYDRISHPAMTDIRIDWGGMNVADVYPRQVPDLFVGRPVIVTGRFNGDGKATVRVKGRQVDRPREIVINADMEAAGPNTAGPRILSRSHDPQDSHPAGHPGIASVWARMQIADLEARATYEGNSELPQQIKQVALEYGLMSAYTAFVAVDSLTRTAGDHGTTVNVPVPVPDGVRYETTVQK
jgi:Ca-activated chloride channel family protein